MKNLPHPRDSEQARPNLTSGTIPSGGLDNLPAQILDQGGHPLLDITDRSNQMPRNSAILYSTPPPRPEVDWPHYRGMLRLLHDGKMFWVGLWPRTVHGQLVYEIKLTPKTEDQR
jgi:hypothetical protein